MKIAHESGTPWSPVRTVRGGVIRFKALLEGREGTPTNYSIVIVYDGDQLVANNRMLAWVNGTQDSGISYTSTIPTSLPVTAHDVVIGRWLNDLQKFNGTMRAAFIAAAAATPAQMPRIFSYLDGC